MTTNHPKKSPQPPTRVAALEISGKDRKSLKKFLSNLSLKKDMALILMPSNTSREKNNFLLDWVPQDLKPKKTRVIDCSKTKSLVGGCIHIAPPGKLPRVHAGQIRLIQPHKKSSPTSPFGELLMSLAKKFPSNCVAIVFANSKFDATEGVKALRRAGGVSFVETLNKKISEISTLTMELFDYRMSAAKIPGEMTAWFQNNEVFNKKQVQKKITEGIRNNLEEVFQILEKSTGSDFRHYKTTSVIRRIQRRLQVLRITSVDEYLSLLKKKKTEPRLLFQELLIGVTEFFRDPDAYDALTKEVLLPLLEQKNNGDVLRIWVTGCSTGQEVYSLAILLKELLNLSKRKVYPQICATDIDPKGLEIARKGKYPLSIEQNVSKDRLERFFTKSSMYYQVNQEIREMCLFSIHNFIADPPFTKMDLISCRNLLIYFNPPQQQKSFSVFHYSLSPGGYLFLGSSESLYSHKSLFTIKKAKERILQRKDMPSQTDFMYPGQFNKANTEQSQTKTIHEEIYKIGQRIILDEFAPEFVIVEENGRILSTSALANNYLSISHGVFDSIIFKLLDYPLRNALRPLLQKAAKDKVKTGNQNIIWKKAGQSRKMGITVQPMPKLGDKNDLFMIVIHDNGLETPTDNEKKGQKSSYVDKLEHELQTTRINLENTIEEMEATNEELKNSNDDLLEMNEELQAANEELNVSKEQIQIGNENLSRTKADLENLLNSGEIAAIFLDENESIIKFTTPVTKIYNLRNGDEGRKLSDITPCFPEIPNLPKLYESSHYKDVEFKTGKGKYYIRKIFPYLTQKKQQKGYVIHFTDITALRQSERKVTEHIRELEAVYSQAPVGLAVLDRDLKFVRVNQSLAEMNQLPIEKHLGKNGGEILPKKYWGQIEKVLREVISTGQPVWNSEFKIRTEYQTKYRNANYMPLKNKSGEINGVNVVIKDTTDRRNFEEALKESRQEASTTKDNLLLALDTGRLGIWNYDYFNNRFSGNNRMYRMFGFDPESSFGLEDLFSRIAEPDKKSLKSVFDPPPRSNNQKVIEKVFRIITGNREEIWISTRSKWICKAEGKGKRKCQLHGILMDVSEHKQRQLEAETANRAKSEFLANMSHEIRTPMTAILGYTDILSRAIHDPDNLSCVETIRKNGKHLIEIINDILDLSKIEEHRLIPKFVYFKPVELISEIISLMQIRADEKKIELKYALGPMPELLISDPVRLRQIIMNLLGNAIKFTDTGYVEIKSEFIPDQKDAHSGKFRVHVIDTGIGMDEAHLETLFRPFSQADTSETREYGGTGLGLTISKRLAELLNGTILVESVKDQGSTFVMQINAESSGKIIQKPNIAASEYRKSQNIPIDISGCKILVVDDRSDVRYLIQSYLEQGKAEVITMPHGKAALDWMDSVSQSENSPEIILMDMQMPVLDGYQTVRQMRMKGIQTPIIALTAAVMKGDRERCMAVGCNDYLPKPVNPRHLFQTIKYYRQKPKEHMQKDHIDVLIVEDNLDAGDSMKLLLETEGISAMAVRNATEALRHCEDFHPKDFLIDLNLPDMKGIALLQLLKANSKLSQSRFFAISGLSSTEDIQKSLDSGFQKHFVKPVEFDEILHTLKS